MESTNTLSTVENVTRIEYRGQLVLTTAQLAEFYECQPKQIKQNYNNNVDRFIEGKHFFKLENDELKNLQVENFDLQISPMTRTLYLWTKRGAARHAKMLNTDRAWDVFEMLEDNYFDRPADTEQNDLENDRRFTDRKRRILEEKLSLEEERLDLERERLLIERRRVEFEREKIYFERQRLDLEYRKLIAEQKRLDAQQGKSGKRPQKKDDAPTPELELEELIRRVIKEIFSKPFYFRQS